METLEDGTGLIREIMPRENMFIRPPISNIDKFILVIAVKDPDPNTDVIDRFIVNAEKAGVEILICINKTDLVAGEKTRELREVYEPIYPVIFLNNKEPAASQSLKEIISGKRVAFAGPSGVGKTTILNLIADTDKETSEVSKKTGRGRHTTRHVETYKVGDSVVYDTPGFTAFEAEDVDLYELSDYFIEFKNYPCRFDNCRHIAEPGCGVKKALTEGQISQSRYNAYKKMSKEIEEKSYD